MASQQGGLLLLLRDRLSFSTRLSFEWSFNITDQNVQDRDKLICWIHHEGNRADREIDLCRELLKEFDIFCHLPNHTILNLGIGLGLESWSLYIHHVHNGREFYQAFDGARVFDYRFHYFPYTPAMEPPEQFVCNELRGLFVMMAQDAKLQAMSGFWLRNRQPAHAVDQVCLSYTYRPKLMELLPYLETWSRADFASYEHVHVKHLAFCADGSLSVYVSARTASFPIDISDVKRQVQAASQTLHQHITQKLQGVSLLPKTRNQFMDDFYSPKDLNAWKKLLGDDMFYHFGLFDGRDDPLDVWNDRPFRNATKDLCHHIQVGERVYDLGAGYGGVSKYLRDEKKCSVLAATISKTQFQYCHNIDVPCRYTDMELSLPPGLFDTILMFESLEHIGNKFALLKKLKRFTRKLVIRTSTQEVPGKNKVFGDSMNVVSSDCVRAILEDCGYRIVHFEDKRAQSLPTFKVWKARLNAVHIEDDSHYSAWKELTNRALTNLDQWASQHLLLDVVAVPIESR